VKERSFILRYFLQKKAAGRHSHGSEDTSFRAQKALRRSQIIRTVPAKNIFLSAAKDKNHPNTPLLCNAATISDFHGTV
jgi:hypothetical protein